MGIISMLVRINISCVVVWSQIYLTTGACRLRQDGKAFLLMMLSVDRLLIVVPVMSFLLSPVLLTVQETTALHSTFQKILSETGFKVQQILLARILKIQS